MRIGSQLRNLGFVITTLPKEHADRIEWMAQPHSRRIGERGIYHPVRNLPPERFATPSANYKNTLVVAPCYGMSGELPESVRWMLESGRRHGVTITTVGTDQPYGGLYDAKVSRLWSATRHLSGFDYLVMVDSTDVLWADGLEALHRSFEEIGKPCVVSGEITNYPWPRRYRYHPLGAERYGCINSGVIMATWQGWLDAMKVVATLPDDGYREDGHGVHSNDQATWWRAWMEGGPIGVDTSCRLAQTMYATDDADIDWTTTPPTNRITGTRPDALALQRPSEVASIRAERKAGVSMRAVIILGVQRSGTSAVAAVVEALGVPIGHRFLPMLPEVCPIGSREDVDFFNVHEAAGWHGAEWPTEIDYGFYRTFYAKLVAERSHLGVWGVKDPRLMWTLPPLLDVLAGVDVRIIRTMRLTADVVDSWVRARWYRRPMAAALVREYERQLADTSAVGPSLSVAFDSMVADPQGTAAAIASFVGLPARAEAAAMILPKIS